MSSGTELATSGRLFQGIIQAIKGRGWFGTLVLRPDQVTVSATTRTALLSDVNRSVLYEKVIRTVEFGVTP